MLPVAVISCAGTACEVVDTHRQQGKADGHNHQAGDNRREELFQRLDKEAQHDLKQTADERSAHNRAVAIGCADGLTGSDKTGAGTHDHRQAAAGFPDGVQLNEGGDAGDKHGVLNQGRFQAGRHLQRAADNEQRRDISQEHGQHMLDAQRNGFGQGDSAVQLVDTACCFVHTWHKLLVLRNPAQGKEPYTKKERGKDTKGP